MTRAYLAILVLLAASPIIGCSSHTSPSAPVAHDVDGAIRNQLGLLVYGEVTPVTGYTTYGVYVEECVDNTGRRLALRGNAHWMAKLMWYNLQFDAPSEQATEITLRARFLCNSPAGYQEVEATIPIRAHAGGSGPAASSRFGQ